MTPLFRKFLGMNWVLFINMIALLTWGIWCIYNASSFREPPLSDKWRDQTIWAGMGFVVYFTTALVDYKWVRYLAGPLYFIGIGLLVVLKFKGVIVNGARSWLFVGGVSLQPSQFAIMAGILALAFVLGDFHRIASVFRHHWLRMLLAAIVAMIPMFMVLKEPALGSAIIWGPVFMSMLLVGSIPMRYIIVLIEIVACVIPMAYAFGLKPYQKARITTYLKMLTNQKVDTLGDAYVANLLQIAVGSAGFEGKGPLSEKVPDHASIHRTFFPKAEAMNDFIFGVIIEEFGFRGGLLQITVIALLLLQCVFIAFYARDQLGRLMVVGTTALMFSNGFMNMGQSLQMTPITGVPMPFVSYGGTFLVMCMFLMGMVQSVWVHRNISAVAKKGRSEDGSESE